MWENIIIRPFDKGDGFFVLYEDDYLHRINVHLEDKSVYEVVDEPDKLVDSLIDKITDWTIEFKDEIGMTSKVKIWVIPNKDNNNPGNMYLNLKAHKPPLYPGRMITTGCSSFIENLSALTAYELKKSTLEYRIVDTPHFLRKIDEFNLSQKLLGKNIIHVGIDVSNMFTNIPRDIGETQCKKHLNKRSDNDKILFSTDCIMKGLQITLDYNISTFNGITYRQVRGAAMGPKNSCEYADNTMDYIDQLVHNKDGVLGPNIIPEFWGRLRDDVYMCWSGTEEELKIFMNWLNNIHPNLTFTYTYSSEGVEFLDLFVYSVDNFIHTKLFSKASDTHCYLIPTSCHKSHVLKNIPYSVARRVRQNNSEDSNFCEQSDIFKEYLKTRGYSSNICDDAFQKFSDINMREDLYSVKDHKKSSSSSALPLVMDNNPALPNMGNIIHRHKHLLDLDPDVKKHVVKENVFVSYRKNKTIGDMLIHNKYKPSKRSDPVNNNAPETVPSTVMVDVTKTSEDWGCFACGKCYCCKKNYLTPCTSFTSYHTEQVFSHTQYVSCQSLGLIYLAECITCEISNVGYTTNNLPKRLSNHKSHIKKGIKSCRLDTHFIDIDHKLDSSSFNSYDESLSKHLKIIILEQVNLPNNATQYEKEKICEMREGYWQTNLKTLERFGGINILDSRIASS